MPKKGGRSTLRKFPQRFGVVAHDLIYPLQEARIRATPGFGSGERTGANLGTGLSRAKAAVFLCEPFHRYTFLSFVVSIVNVPCRIVNAPIKITVTPTRPLPRVERGKAVSPGPIGLRFYG